MSAALDYETQVDDTSDHIVSNVALSGHPTQTDPPYCSKVVWSDDRLNPGVNWHIFFQHVCSDGYHLYAGDVQADENPVDLNATNPSVAYRQDITYAVAWQSERSAGSSYHDVYTRYFNAWGGYVNDQLRVNDGVDDARYPAVASDTAGDIFVAWQEGDMAPSYDGRILISKYDYYGNLIVGPVRVDNQAPGVGRYSPALAVDDAGNVIVSWWEGYNAQVQSIFRSQLSNALVLLHAAAQVNQPPGVVGAGQRAEYPSVATDGSGNSAIAWMANVNGVFNGFARSFDSSSNPLKNDFRLDLAPRAAYVVGPSVARSLEPGEFAYAWRDNRSGKYDVYTRVVPSLN